MAQELGVIERDPNFVNPYKRETRVPDVSFFVPTSFQLVTKIQLVAN